MSEESDVGQVRIFDTTLRDGEQSPGCTMNGQQKLTMAHALADLGVDVIEAGFAASSEADAGAIASIASKVRGVSIASLARCTPGDLDAASRALEMAEQPLLHLFISTSPLHRKHKLNMSRQQIVDTAASMVAKARQRFDVIEFSAEDALRTEPEFLVEIFTAVAEAGAQILNVPDTVGYTTPDEIRALFEHLLVQIPGSEALIFSAHCHNDLGLAVANSLAALAGGARQVECTINGIGERAGNCALEELVMALRTRADHYALPSRINTRGLLPASRLLSRITGMEVQRNKAIVGANAFAHEAGIHQHGMLKHSGTYEIMRPQDVGWDDSQMVLGRHSGRAALADRLAQLGFHLDEALLNQVFARFKQLAARKAEILDADLQALMANRPSPAPHWRLKAFHISTGAGEGSQPAAVVEIIDPERRLRSARGMGDGPVHALFEALAAATGIDLEVDSFQVHSVTGGDDAQGQAHLIAHYAGEKLTASGISTDILEASALAWLELANRLIRRSPNSLLQTPSQEAARAQRVAL